MLTSKTFNTVELLTKYIIRTFDGIIFYQMNISAIITDILLMFQLKIDLSFPIRCSLAGCQYVDVMKLRKLIRETIHIFLYRNLENNIYTIHIGKRSRSILNIRFSRIRGTSFALAGF